MAEQQEKEGGVGFTQARHDDPDGSRAATRPPPDEDEKKRDEIKDATEEAIEKADESDASVQQMLRDSQVGPVLDELDKELIALTPVKTRIREIAALLVIDRLREEAGLNSERPTLHMSFTGNPGTGKTTVARKMGQILFRLGYVDKGHLVSVTRDDLVGEYVGHTAPKTKEVVEKAMGGVLFIDEAYYLYRPENERDYGPEAIEVLLQVMEDERENLVVVLAGYKDRMEEFFKGSPGMGSRIAHHIDFPDYTVDELMQIADLMVDQQGYKLSDEAKKAFREYLERRMKQPLFAHGRSIRNAIERARLRHANRLFQRDDDLSKEELMTIEADDIYKSSVFEKGVDEDEDEEQRDEDDEAEEAEPEEQAASAGTS
jgi:probable Rubsico expression protein CbbX